MQALRALLAQVVGFTAGLGVASMAPEGHPFGPLHLAASAVSAAAFAHLVLRQPRWWLPLHLAFLPSLGLASRLEVGSGVWLFGLLALALVFWGTFKGDVPLYLSSPAVTEAVAELLVARPESRFAELGAGVGTVAVPLARRFAGLRVEAWERAPLPYLLCRARAARLDNLRVRRQDFWAADLSQYDVVFAFLSPVVMARLSAKVRTEMRPGTLFVSAAFPCAGWMADEEHVLDDRRATHLYVHRIP